MADCLLVTPESAANRAARVDLSAVTTLCRAAVLFLRLARLEAK